MEIWDLYDVDFNKIEGMTHERGTPVPEGYYHLVCDVLIRHVDGRYLLMQRAPTKNNGGKWEGTAGGSALSGETPLQCAVRELREETGVTAIELHEVDRYPHHVNRTYYVEFEGVTDCDPDSVVLQEGETSAYQWVDVATLKTLFNSDQMTLRTKMRIADIIAAV